MTITTHDLLDFGLPSPTQAVLQVWRSALVLAPRTATACTDAYLMHQLVERGLGLVTTTGTRNGRTLYAAARNPARHHPHRPLILHAGQPHTLLVQTASPPDWTPLQNAQEILSARTELVEQTWTTGDTGGIRTIASPLVTKNNDDRQRRRVPLTSPGTCGTWLHDRLLRAGCTLDRHDITMNDPEQTHQQGRTITLRHFQATVTITDPHAFTKLLTAGLGHNRAWGAGLVLARHTKKRQSD